MNNFIDELIEGVIAAEIVIIFLLVVFVYIMYAYLSFKRKRDKKRRDAVDKAFVDLYKEKVIKSLPYSNIPYLLIRAFLAWDVLHRKNADWNENKMIVLKTQIIPKSLKYAYSFDWVKRYLLVQCFEYYVDVNYEDLVIKLVNDKASMVSIDATKIALDLNTEASLSALVDRVSRARYPFQSLFLAQLHATTTFYEVLKEKLTHVKNTTLLKTCYRILKQIGATDLFFEEAKRDLKTEKLELKLSVITVLADISPKVATPILIQLLSDKNWLVRNKAVQSMGNLKKEDILEPIARLMQDDNWWVRINAAKILATFGEEGRAVLAKHENIAGYAASHEADYFLKIRSIQESS